MKVLPLNLINIFIACEFFVVVVALVVFVLPFYFYIGCYAFFISIFIVILILPFFVFRVFHQTLSHLSLIKT